ncbi:MAG: rRNA maturation RNase YbeY [Cyanobacteria bacterium J06628_6]
MATSLTVEIEVEADTPLPDDLADVDWSACFERWLTLMAPTQSPIGAYELALRLTSDDGIQQLNAAYRHQDQSTDVLAFAALESELPGAEALYQEQPVYLGDIIISVETAQRQAIEAAHSLEQELLWLATHGLLHLLGWDHPDKDSLNQMLSQQAVLIEASLNSAEGGLTAG